MSSMEEGKRKDEGRGLSFGEIEERAASLVRLLRYEFGLEDGDNEPAARLDTGKNDEYGDFGCVTHTLIDRTWESYVNDVLCISLSFRGDGTVDVCAHACGDGTEVVRMDKVPGDDWVRAVVDGLLGKWRQGLPSVYSSRRRYTVVYTETNVFTREVEAANRQEAEERMMKMIARDDPDSTSSRIDVADAAARQGELLDGEDSDAAGKGSIRRDIHPLQVLRNQLLRMCGLVARTADRISLNVKGGADFGWDDNHRAVRTLMECTMRIAEMNESLRLAEMETSRGRQSKGERKMSNYSLWDETVGFLESEGYCEGDIYAIFGDKFQVTLENFREVAQKTHYNSGYGSQEVACDLVIMLVDGKWLRRTEYDGKEEWTLEQVPEIPSRVEAIKTLAREFGGELADLNGLDEKQN